ncbi:MAG TPA: DUF1365 domain-containing protein [Acidobacteriaceae bacterium]|nr:DUF1365 domain-containing protein [Acidobacteriaceae bacterium]
MIEPGIYAGTLRHRRWLPRRHEFTYPLFLAFLDIDRLPDLMRISPWSSYNRANVVSYRDRDHFGDASQTLRHRLERDARDRGLEAPAGRVFLLTHLRYWGYNFNPVSFYYCYGMDRRLQSVLAEVNNTFGETHNYWLTSGLETPAGTSKRYRFDKAFHVSPFFRMRQGYDWTFSPPGDRLVVECMNFEDGELAFDSTLALERREWTRRELHRAILGYPLMTARVIAAIHWQALRLLLKRVPVVPHPGKGHYARRNTREMGASWKPQ